MAGATYAGVTFDAPSNGADSASTPVRRCDLAELASPTTTREGFLRAEGVLTRSGIFEYVRQDGTTVREYRPPEEVFDAESLRSIALLPVTLQHPPDLLSPKTVREYQVGSVGQPGRTGDFVKAEVLLTDQRAIEAAAGGTNKLSLGYWSTIIPRAGSVKGPDGSEQRFDAIQTRMRGNHLALCTTPRAGENAFIRMDSGDLVMVDPKPHPAPQPPPPTPAPTPAPAPAPKPAPTPAPIETQSTNTVKYKIGDQEFDLPEAVVQEMQRRDSASERLQGQLAAADAEKKAAEAKRMDEAEIAARLELALKAAPILKKPPEEIARMDSAAIRRAVVLADDPSTNLDGKSDDYVAGMFERVAKRVDTAAMLRVGIAHGQANPVGLGDDAEAEKRIDDARAAMLQRNAEAWKPKARYGLGE